MTQHSSVNDELHNLLDSFFEPSKDEKYVRDLERDIMALIEAEYARAALEENRWLKKNMVRDITGADLDSRYAELEAQLKERSE